MSYAKRFSKQSKTIQYLTAIALTAGLYTLCNLTGTARSGIAAINTIIYGIRSIFAIAAIALTLIIISEAIFGRTKKAGQIISEPTKRVLDISAASLGFYIAESLVVVLRSGPVISFIARATGIILLGISTLIFVAAVIRIICATNKEE